MTASQSAAGRGRRLPRRLSSAAFWFLVPFVVLAAVWAVVVDLTGVPQRTFPQITDVASTFVEWTTDEVLSLGNLLPHLAASLRRVAIGVLAALVTGIPFGVLLGSSRVASAFFAPLLRFSVALAGIAWIPLATLWLGLGERAVIFIVWNAMFFALTYNAMLGVQRIPTELLRAARSMGTDRKSVV